MMAKFREVHIFVYKNTSQSDGFADSDELKIAYVFRVFGLELGSMGTGVGEVMPVC
jgi:hypothetical protein